MEREKLYNTVETIASQRFSSKRDMMIEVLNQIVDIEHIDVNSGRLWKLDTQAECYTLIYQTGKINRIEDGFRLYIKDYPIFNRLVDERTIVEDETNEELKETGILRFSAAGVGDKIKMNDNFYYEYLLALNSEKVDEEFRLTLSIIATTLTSKIREWRHSTRAKSLKADIDKGRELQKSILPQHELQFHNYELFGITDPAEIVGGDFFDYLEVGDDNERLGVVVGDAASKGVGAAAEAMYISGAIRMASNFEIKISSLVKKTNQLVNKIFTDEKFASLFYCEISNDEGGLCLYANAGHNSPIFIKSNSNQPRFLDSTGPVLGPISNSTYRIENINFDKDDVLLIYSDGVIDSADSNFEGFGEERLIKLLNDVKHLSPKGITYEILDEVIRHSVNGKYNDDKTIVVIKRVN